MSGETSQAGSTVVPGLRYDDPEAAVAFLCSAFGFADRGVFRDPHGAIVHAQITFGNGMVMLGPNSNPELRERMAVPAEVGGRSTQAIFVVVEDADKHLVQAVAGGAVILKDIRDQDYGGRGYTCADPEGHVWEFGTYDPWK